MGLLNLRNITFLRNLLFLIILLVEVFGFSKLAHSASFSDSVLIGGSGPADSKAQLDVKSTTKYVLVPRMTTTQQNAITSPTEGALIYDNVLHQLSNYNGTSWTAVGGPPAAATASTLGTVKSTTVVSHQFLTGLTTGTGAFTQAQPAFSDISGSVAAAQLPNPSSSSLGGVQSAASVAHQWINSISTSGVPALSQPAFSDISGSVAASQLPNPSASTLGGVQSAAAVSHQWINSISTSGVPALSQPAFSDISGTASLTSQVTGVLPYGNGGTGQSSYTDGQLLIGNTATGGISKATLTAGTNVTITNGNGTISIAATSGAVPSFNYTSQSTTYSATIGDWVVASSASFVITLPTAVGQSGKSIVIQHAGTSLSQVYQLNTTSAQTVGGIASGSYSLYTNGEILWVMSDGSNWRIIQHLTSTGPNSYSPSLTGGWGTATAISYTWSRRGSWMKVEGAHANGTVATGSAVFPLPTGATIDSTKIYNCGTGSQCPNVGLCISNGQANAFAPMLAAVLTSTSQVYLGGLINGSASLIPTTTANTVIGVSNQLSSIEFEVPISGWQP